MKLCAFVANIMLRKQLFKIECWNVVLWAFSVGWLLCCIFDITCTHVLTQVFCWLFTELRDNKLLGELLHVVLAAGNFLNAVSTNDQFQFICYTTPVLHTLFAYLLVREQKAPEEAPLCDIAIVRTQAVDEVKRRELVPSPIGLLLPLLLLTSAIVDKYLMDWSDSFTTRPICYLIIIHHKFST